MERSLRWLWTNTFTANRWDGKIGIQRGNVFEKLGWCQVFIFKQLI
jgi:hypothetical protein